MMASKDGNRRKSMDKAPAQKPVVGKSVAPLRSPDSSRPSAGASSLSTDWDADASSLASPLAKNTPAAETLTVIARFREPKANAKPVPSPYVFMDQKVVKVNFDAYESKTYQFDTVFPPTTQQHELFEAVEGTIDAVMNGFNATILAYGQTSAGKTHTMEGPNIRANLSLLNGGTGDDGGPNQADSQLGIIPRTIEKLFLTVNEPKYSHMEFSIMVSYFEIYCERLRDLLFPSADNMKLREYSLPGKPSERSVCAGFVVQDITEIVCKNANDIYNVIDTGKSHRATAPTLMNAESSRSHSILLIKCNQKPSESIVSTLENAAPSTKRAARLYLVDLAGSEKVGKTGATGERLKEAQNINKSLTSFGMVINALSEGLSHVPYRDSKLTMILMDSIGGNSKTTLIICCSPEAAQLSETLSTLRFGERAKKITNTVKVNEELGISEYKALCQAYKSEITALKKKLAAAEEMGSSFDASDGTAVGSGEKSPEARRQATEAAVAAQEALEKKLEAMQYRCMDLEAQLEAEKNENIGLKVEASADKSEVHLLKCLTQELQGKLFKATTTLQAPVVSPTVNVDPAFSSEDDDDKEAEKFHTPGQSPKAVTGGSSEKDGAVTKEDLKEISEQHAVLTQHIMDETKHMQAISATGAAQSAELAEYIEKYYTLNKTSNDQIDRIMAKLSSEQNIRVNAELQYAELLEKYHILEDQLAEAQKSATAASEEESGSSFSNLFSSPSRALSPASPTSKRSSWTNMMSGAAAKMFSDNSGPSYQRTAQSSQALQAIIQAQSKQLQTFTQANAKLQTMESQLQYELECTKEQYETLLVMKDNILKTILGENKELVEQKEAFMAEQHEHLATIEQLTYLLRTSMERKAADQQQHRHNMQGSASYESGLSELDEERYLDGDAEVDVEDDTYGGAYPEEDDGGELDEELVLESPGGGDFEEPVRDEESPAGAA